MKKSVLSILIFMPVISSCGLYIHQYALVDFVFDKNDNTVGDEAQDAAADPDGDGEVEPVINGIIEGDTACERLVDGMAEFENYHAMTGDTNATRIIGYYHEIFENADCPI